jgi:hypothetical protein
MMTVFYVDKSKPATKIRDCSAERGTGAAPGGSPVREGHMATGRTFIHSAGRDPKGALMHCL